MKGESYILDVGFVYSDRYITFQVIEKTMDSDYLLPCPNHAHLSITRSNILHKVIHAIKIFVSIKGVT